MNPIPFSKMNGSGNDFIIIDNRQGLVGQDVADRLARQVCRRKLSVGADGLILIEAADDADFRWRFYNSDGSRAEMCGNGARCAARFAWMNGIAGMTMTFETDAGRISAEMLGERVKVGLTDPTGFLPELDLHLSFGKITLASVNTGVPHAVIETDELESVDVETLGREIRNHPRFQPAGTNVNFCRRTGDRRISVRTYERGVESETLACGTGATAAALVTAVRHGMGESVEAVTRSGGVLTVHFQSVQDGFRSVFLEGDARLVYTGSLMADALME
ncbi:MAG: diaminopimelate epimerase [Desulfobacterales bacterium]